MVTYFTAGTSFYVKTGKNRTSTSLDALCGHTVGVEKGTTQLDDATAQSTKCTSAGKAKVTVAAFPDQNGANLALGSGRVDVVMADSPVADYAAKQSNGAFEVSRPALRRRPVRHRGPQEPDYAGLDNAILGALKQLQRRHLHQDPGQVGRAGRRHHRLRASTAATS